MQTTTIIHLLSILSHISKSLSVILNMASSSPAVMSPQRNHTQPFSSPSTSPKLFPSILCDSKILHLADISYPESYLRTPLPLLPFQQPKWLDQQSSEGVSPIMGAWEYDDSGEVVLESIEGSEGSEGSERSSEVVSGNVWGDGKREWTFWEERVSSKRGWTVLESPRSLKRTREDLEGDLRNKKKCRA
jgi:hypothetical protein